MDSRVITISTIQQIGLFFCYSCPGRVIRRCKWTIRSIHQIRDWNQCKETIEFVKTPKNCEFPTEQKVSSREMFENCKRFQEQLDENVVAIWLVSKSRATSINESEQNQPQSPTWLPRTRFPALRDGCQALESQWWFYWLIQMPTFVLIGRCVISHL